MSSRKEQARARAAELRKAEEQAQRRRERLVRGGVALAVVAVVVVAGLLLQNRRTEVDETAALPATVTEPGGGLVLGPADAPVTMAVWEDFQCPACKQFEATNAATIAAAVADGRAQVTFHPLHFLDRNLDNDSSRPAANAFGCAVDSGDEAAALAFHDRVFEAQPEEQPGVDAWSQDDLIGFGTEAGLDAEWESCVRDGTYLGWADQVDASSAEAGVNSTPTVFVDGEKVSDEQLTQMFSDASVLEGLLAR